MRTLETFTPLSLEEGLSETRCGFLNKGLAEQALDLEAKGRIDIRAFLDFVYRAPKRKSGSLLPPRPRSALSAR